MAYFSFQPDVRLYSSQWNTDVRQQLIITCSSGSRPTSNLIAGMRIYETDTRREYIYSGSDWVLYNEPGMCLPWEEYNVSVVAYSGSFFLGNGSLIGRYRKVGKTYDVRIEFVAGSTTVFSPSAWMFSIPFALNTMMHTGGGLASVATTLFPVFLETVIYAGYNYVIPDSYISSSDAQIGYMHSTRPATWTTGNWMYIQFKGVEA